MIIKKSAAAEDVLLNLIRVGSAFSIAIWHFQLLIPQSNQIQISTEEYPFHKALNILYTRGFLAVQLFWVISGFVIAKAYIDSKWEPRRFLRNRFARLYPLHLLTLLMVTFLQIVIKNSEGSFAICNEQDLFHFFLNLFFVPALGFEEGCSFNAPIWSVSVELISYLAFAILLTFWGKLTLRKLIFINVFTFNVLIFNPLNLPIHVLECALFFFAGVTLFRLSKSNSKFPIYTFLFIVLFVFLKTQQIELGGTNLKESSIPWLLAFGAILMIQDWANKKFKFLIPLRSASERMGDLTYSSYLLQFPVIIGWLVFCSYSNFELEPQDLPYLMVGYILVLFGLSHITFQKFEKPWRESLRKKTYVTVNFFRLT